MTHMLFDLRSGLVGMKGSILSSMDCPFSPSLSHSHVLHTYLYSYTYMPSTSGLNAVLVRDSDQIFLLPSYHTLLIWEGV